MSSDQPLLTRSPSPAPPKRRVVDASTWEENIEQRWALAGRNDDAGILDREEETSSAGDVFSRENEASRFRCVN